MLALLNYRSQVYCMANRPNWSCGRTSCWMPCSLFPTSPAELSKFKLLHLNPNKYFGPGLLQPALVFSTLDFVLAPNTTITAREKLPKSPPPSSWLLAPL